MVGFREICNWCDLSHVCGRNGLNFPTSCVLIAGLL
ncbi:Kazal-type serine protease inhibitor domain-containing protein [Corynebacterium choanae]